MKYLIMLLCLSPWLAFADARIEESPAICHVPYSNTNVDAEFKMVGCKGFLRRNQANVYNGSLHIFEQNVSGGSFVIDGQDVRDTEAYPGGSLAIVTSSAESGTACNMVSDGVTYSTNNWTARTVVTRAQFAWNVNVEYRLTCWGGVAQ